MDQQEPTAVHAAIPGQRARDTGPRRKSQWAGPVWSNKRHTVSTDIGNPCIEDEKETISERQRSQTNIGKTSRKPISQGRNQHGPKKYRAEHPLTGPSISIATPPAHYTDNGPIKKKPISEPTQRTRTPANDASDARKSKQAKRKKNEKTSPTRRTEQQRASATRTTQSRRTNNKKQEQTTTNKTPNNQSQEETTTKEEKQQNTKPNKEPSKNQRKTPNHTQ
ncbi:hypothetical protein [Bifidobacterium saguini]|uniref:hypothetical protein n=1 Tax=Bifidobacterium saguini TaxID=762210 RepID=UPI0012698C08|nr:hypothetical protein [Bifidobacterium saguini]